MRRLVLLTLALAAGLPGPSRANDSSAQLAAGGLVLTRSDAIEMRTEDLEISRSAVQVRYTFVNTSGKDVVSRVAFPLPAVGGRAFFEMDIAIPLDSPDNFLGFETRVDGKPVKMEVAQKAMVGQAERTAWLRAHGVPLAPHLGPAQEALENLAPAALAEAKRLGLVDADGYPNWTLETTYHWLQRFPAGVPVLVEHRYKPSVGGTVSTLLGSDPDADTVRTYCVDSALLAALRRAEAKQVIYSEGWLDYILVTAGNWKKPIGKFRLVIDKERPEDLVSFCGEGVRKIAPTRFEMTRTNWRPERDLSILFLERRSGK
ncbi:MAG: hypothetical protein K0R64_2426 [Novosphingobium lindaniclasticum]|jgi:hypothetical protein|uniref:DUF4424 domain-containing protein n=1 Tax=Novosphingobium lindaniclasticum TaxID=1329895 RepID=UPI00240983D6|nr:DUF4424 domain-containing protein [Novosphingobium lindaniclasticum]MDF2639442.1 hypothetical protein [Novosphingobium lindaniclasticum]